MNAPAEVSRRAVELTELYRAESGHIVHLAYLLTGERPLAEDLAQEAFFRVASRLRDVHPDAFGAYLRKTVVNLVRSHFRHARVQRRYADRVEAEAVRSREAAEAGAGVTDTETRAELWAALQALPVHQREAIVCRYYLDMSEEQTAQTLNVRVGTVKSATSRGLQSLRATLGSGEER